MKRLLALIAVLAISGTAFYLAERRRHPDAVSANAVVDMAADWQRDVSRVPLHLTRVSDEEEIRLGNVLASQYMSNLPLANPEQRATEKYINLVGGRVAAHARRRLPYRFHLIPSHDLVNAFALPGGHVCVGQGLAERMMSEDELAFVLGHEIEHIDHYHAIERVQVEAQLKNLNLDILADLAGLPMALWQTGYSKDEESEADREGLRIAVAAGYSAQGAVDQLQRWTKLRDEYVIHAETPTEEVSELTIQGLTGYFRTHPEPSERLAQIQAVIASDHLPTNEPLKQFHVEYEITTEH